MLDTLVGLATTGEFLAGLRWGLIALLISLSVGVWWRAGQGSPAPMGGIVLTIATLWVLPVTLMVPVGIWIGLVLLAIAGWLGSLSRSSASQAAVTAAAAIPGAVVIGLIAESRGPAWARWLIVLGVVITAPLVAEFDAHYRQRAWGLPLFAISVLGLLFTVPDTEEALVLAGVVLPLALLGGPVRLVSLGRAGSLMAVGVFLWIAVIGGVGRPGSIIGAAASLGLLAVEPIARWFRSASWLETLHRPWSAVLVVGAFQLALVLLTSRVAGLQVTPGAAGIIAGVALVMAIAIFASLATGRTQ